MQDKKTMLDEDRDENSSTDLLVTTAQPPNDKYYMAWIACLLLGVAQLYPWNALLSINDWFDLKFCPFPFLFVMSILFNWPNVIVLFIMTKWGHLIPVKVKLYGAYFTIFILLFLMPLINQFPDVLSLNLRIALSLVFVFALGMCVATLLGTGFGLVALLPPKYTTALMVGQGLAGIIAALIQLLFNFVIWTPVNGTNHLSPIQISDQGWVYYAIAALLILVCCVMTAYLMTLPFYQYYQRKAGFQILKDSTSNQSSGQYLDQINSPDNGYTPTDEPDVIIPTVSIMGVFSKLWLDAINVFSTFFITLSLFPGFTVLVVASDMPQRLFMPILIGLFQLFDLVGRSIPQFYVPPDWTQKFLFVPVVIRFAFFPLFIFNVAWNGHDHAFFQADWIPFVVMICFAVSNGYISTLSMMWGPQKLQPHEQQVGGTMMTLFLQLGILAGVHTALLLKYVVTGEVMNAANASSCAINN